MCALHALRKHIILATYESTSMLQETTQAQWRVEIVLSANCLMLFRQLMGF